MGGSDKKRLPYYRGYAVDYKWRAYESSVYEK